MARRTRVAYCFNIFAIYMSLHFDASIYHRPVRHARRVSGGMRWMRDGGEPVSMGRGNAGAPGWIGADGCRSRREPRRRRECGRASSAAARTLKARRATGRAMSIRALAYSLARLHPVRLLNMHDLLVLESRSMPSDPSAWRDAYVARLNGIFPANRRVVV